MNWNFQNAIRSNLWGFALTTAWLALIGCNNAQAPQPAKIEAATPKWHVSVLITGGIAGQSRSISINHQGEAQFTDKLNKTQKNSQISITNLNKLEQLVKDYSSDTAKSYDKTKACRDCFSYTINTEYDGNENRRQVTDLNMDEKSQRLIGALQTISSEHEKSN